MTNATIVLLESVKLMEKGIIKPTGKIIKVNVGGIDKEFPEAEAIHTFAVWKQHGRQVKKGEKAVASFPIWKHTTKQLEVDKEMEAAGDDGKRESMFMKNAHWFTIDQTEPIKAK